jgi:cation transport protein ChaC
MLWACPPRHVSDLASSVIFYPRHIEAIVVAGLASSSEQTGGAPSSPDGEWVAFWTGSLLPMTAPNENDCGDETRRDVLSRDLLATGAFADLLAKDAPGQTLLSEAERSHSLMTTLSARPLGDVWVFAYGSLIWNPIISHVESRPARVNGWHRSFCLAAISGRGSPENPGLVLGLDEGGYCEGIALRVPESCLETELELLWRREMVAGSYIPRWVDLMDDEGRRFGSGIAFTIDRTAATYAGELDHEARIQRLATASGSIGSSAEYLFRTHERLIELGIRDDSIVTLARDVKKAQEG